ncbi:MAG: DUF6596 domain-containing protein [Aliidongia sp.]
MRWLPLDPQAVGALLRYFRDLDLAEEAFQEAALRALKSWPQKRTAARSRGVADPGRPECGAGRRAQDPAAAAAAAGRRESPISKTSETPPRRAASTARITATTCCVCCSFAAIRSCRRRSRSRSPCAFVSGLTVPPVARSLPGWRRGDGAAHHPRQGAHRPCRCAVRDAWSGRAGRKRLATVAAMVYLLFNEGYSAANDPSRAPLSDEAIRLVRLLLRLFQTEPENHGAGGADAVAAGEAAGTLRRRGASRSCSTIRIGPAGTAS